MGSYRRRGRPLGARKGWFSGYSGSRFFPGLWDRGRDAPLTPRSRLVYRLIIAALVAGGVALILVTRN
jgi:hypothetical protein